MKHLLSIITGLLILPILVSCGGGGITDSDTTAPAVSSVTPASGATGVSISTDITATFSETMDSSTITTSTFTVGAITGTVTYSGTTATFTPSSNLSYSTIYTATITTGVKDSAGNAMASKYIWSFTTEGATYTPTELQISQGVVTVWTFTDPQDPLASSQGPAKLSYRDPTNTGWGPLLTKFEKISILGLPPVNGKDKTVMAFPATDKDQGYTITHYSLPNGVFADDDYVSNYTIIMDILWNEENSKGYRSFYQASADNSDDAEFFAENKVGGGIGVGGNYTGELSPDQWHRVAIAVQCALGAGGTGQLHKYIDGRFVGGQYTPGNGPRCPWALEPVFHLFTDDNGETAEGYVSSIMYVDRLMSMDEITALGGSVAEGANFYGTNPPPVVHTAERRGQIIAHRANSGYSPENTLVGIKQAFDEGADAVEVDVRITKDGELVLMHDEDISRTTDGTGLVLDINLTELKKLDAGSWFSPFYASEQVPTLTEALKAAKGRGKLLLDVKSLQIGSYIKRSLNEAGVGDDAIWPSQNVSDTAAEDFKKYMPDAGILWMGIPDPLTKEEFDKLKDKGVTGFDIDYSLATKEFIDAAHLNGMFVFVYTVMDPDTMLYLIDIGVDGMETDFPGVLNSIMPKE